MNEHREGFASRIGFILVSAGCAIGIGNVWKFPWEAGANGGGIFVLFYLIFIAIMGIPVLTMELAVGRAGGSSARNAFQKLEPQKSKWHLYGWGCVIGCALLMMYYTTVTGWMLSYFYKFLTGKFETVGTNEQVGAAFSNMLGNTKEMLLWMCVAVVIGFLVCILGIQNGIEKITKVMMLSLLILIVVLAIHSLTLKGAADGVKFYLLPSIKRAKQIGIGNVITAAMNQAFFTLSLGIGAMEIFGSYMKKDNTITGEATRICILDTFVALMAGLIIFPACFSFGVEPDQGPSLIFITLPNVFIHMEGGRIWGTLFFLFMSFASISTVIAVFENLIASNIDNFGWSRKKSSLINFGFILIGSIPCVLGYNLWQHVKILGVDILGFEDFLVSNLLLPLGSLVFLLFCVTKWGWNFDDYMDEVNTGKGMRLSKALKPYFRYVLPILILVIFVQGLVNTF